MRTDRIGRLRWETIAPCDRRTFPPLTVSDRSTVPLSRVVTTHNRRGRDDGTTARRADRDRRRSRWRTPPQGGKLRSRRPGRHARRRAAHPGRAGGIVPQALQALRHAIARLAIDLVSGPSGIAAILRTGLLDHPWNTPSLPLGIG